MEDPLFVTCRSNSSGNHRFSTSSTWVYPRVLRFPCCEKDFGATSLDQESGHLEAAEVLRHPEALSWTFAKKLHGGKWGISVDIQQTTMWKLDCICWDWVPYVQTNYMILYNPHTILSVLITLVDNGSNWSDGMVGIIRDHCLWILRLFMIVHVCSPYVVRHVFAIIAIIIVHWQTVRVIRFGSNLQVPTPTSPHRHRASQTWKQK